MILPSHLPSQNPVRHSTPTPLLEMRVVADGGAARFLESSAIMIRPKFTCGFHSPTWKKEFDPEMILNNIFSEPSPKAAQQIARGVRLVCYA